MLHWHGYKREEITEEKVKERNKSKDGKRCYYDDSVREAKCKQK